MFQLLSGKILYKKNKVLLDRCILVFTQIDSWLNETHDKWASYWNPVFEL